MKYLAISGSLYLAAFTLALDQFDPASYASKDVLERDIAVVGGGASGTYAAISVRDRGKSVILVERNARLGGQTETYTDPKSGTTVDYGVQAYHNDTVTNAFFARFKISTAEFTFGPPSTPLYADFESGTALQNFSGGAVGTDYAAQLNRYPYLNNGFRLPKPVPEDLLLPWGKYIEKYSLQDSAWATTAARPAPPGNLLELPTIYVFNSYNNIELSEGEGRGNALVSAKLDNSEIYRKALAELGTDVLLSSTVIAGNRSAERTKGIRLVVKTPAGKKLVVAKQLVLGMPPILANTNSYGLDSHEKSILSKLKGYPYYAGLVSNTGLSQSYWYTNAGTNTPYHVPNMPSFMWFKPTLITGQFLYWYNALQPKTQAEVESAATATINRLHKITSSETVATPVYEAFANHTPFHLYVSPQDITNGFYNDMYSLQGYKNTWYISALFAVGSSQLWNDTANLLPKILAAAE